MFVTNSFVVESKLKQNPYIESVQLKRYLPHTMNIVVKERKVTYMLETENQKYAYINNQGYILEINENPTNVPQITSYKTQDIENVTRLVNEDLEKLEIILKVMEIANANQIGNLITQIDIEKKDNLILKMESEKKIIYIGDGSDINTKILYMKAVLEDEKGIEGELFMDGKTNKEGEFLFRQKV